MVVGQCPVCRRSVYSLDSHTIDHGIDYHPQCWIKANCIKISRLDRKAERKDITLEEAEELKDLKTLLQKEINDNNNATQQKKLNRNLGYLVTKPQHREQILHSNIEKEIKRTDTLRFNRWAWESFNIIEKQILIEGTEQKMITDGRSM